MSYPCIPQRCLVSMLQRDPLWLSSTYLKNHNSSTSPPTNHLSLPVLNGAHDATATSTRGNDSVDASAVYHKNIWTHDFVDSLEGGYKADIYNIQVEELKLKVKDVLNDESVGAVTKLVFIDDIQRLGLAYHFEKEAKRALSILQVSTHGCLADSLYSTALYFRILRQNGYQVFQDVFNRFKDEEGNFRVELCEDVDGMLSLYEASHLRLEGENILLQARDFTIKHLTNLINKNINPNLAQEVRHALELPLHLRMPRLEARDYIDAYESKADMNPILLQLAKLDFNALQATHQKELRDLSRWWNHLGLAKKLGFARDRLVEGFLWSLGLAHEPQYQRCREWITKVVCLIIIIDDIYDIQGSLEELELFTSAVDRWDVKAMEQLPDYIQLCFLPLLDTTNDIVNTIYAERGVYILSHLKKVWTDLCKAMMVEAKWRKMRYTPSLVEYLENAWISSSTAVGLVHAFFGTNQTINTDVLNYLDNSDLIYYSGMICRLCNDLATSSAELDRGEIASTIQCYMHEANISEQDARESVKDLISGMWKKLNGSLYDSSFDKSFLGIAFNHARTAQSIYQRGDGISVQDYEAKKRVARLLVKPVTPTTGTPSVLMV